MTRHRLARKLALVAIIAQILVLAYMAGKREYIQATGEKIYLRSAPIDPRDPFRGDFVRLRYNINTVHEKYYQGETQAEHLVEGSVLYAVLKRGPQDVFTFDYLTDQEPSGEIFIKGRLTRDWRFARLWADHYINVKYGIEQYFVQQGKGKEMEARLGDRNSLQVPVEMELALGDDGTAVITGYRWSQLGIQLEFIRTPQTRTNPDDPVLSPIVKITLQNVSDKTLALPMQADQCGISLAHLNGNNLEKYADRGCTPALAGRIEPVVLEPNATYSTELDFSQPRWHIEHEGKRMEMSAIEGWQQFRVTIHLPPTESPLTDHNGIPFWFGELETPLFNGAGRID